MPAAAHFTGFNPHQLCRLISNFKLPHSIKYSLSFLVNKGFPVFKSLFPIFENTNAYLIAFFFCIYLRVKFFNKFKFFIS